jgi:hypothetical protein
MTLYLSNIQLVIVICPHFMVRDVAISNMAGDDQISTGHGCNCLFFPTTDDQSEIQGMKTSILTSDDVPTGFHQSSKQSAFSVFGLLSLTLSGTFVVSRTNLCPRTHVTTGGEPTHLHSDLSIQGLRSFLVHTRNGHRPPLLLQKRA